MNPTGPTLEPTLDWAEIEARILSGKIGEVLATPEAVLQAEAERKEKSRKAAQKPDRRAEEWVRNWCASKLGAKLKKQTVATGQWRGGVEIRAKVGLDFAGDMRLPGSKFSTAVQTEVKSVTSGKFDFKSIKPHQRQWFDEATQRGVLAFLSLVWWERPMDSRMGAEYTMAAYYPVLWPDWLKIEEEMRDQASGNFKGNSIRVRDLPILEPYAIRKIGCCWPVPQNHWLNLYTRGNGNGNGADLFSAISSTQ